MHAACHACIIVACCSLPSIGLATAHAYLLLRIACSAWHHVKKAFAASHFKLHFSPGIILSLLLLCMSSWISCFFALRNDTCHDECCGNDVQAQIPATACDCRVHPRSWCSPVSQSWHMCFKLTLWPPMLSQSTAIILHLTH